MPKQLKAIRVKTSYAKVGSEYEVCGVEETEIFLNENEELPKDEWVNEYLQYEYFYQYE